MTRNQKRFIFSIVGFYIVCFGLILFWGIIGNIQAITILGVTLGIFGIIIGEVFLVYLLWHTLGLPVESPIKRKLDNLFNL